VNLYFSSPASQENFRRSRTSDQNNSSIEFQKIILFGGFAASARRKKVNKDSVSLSPHSHVTPCVTKNIFSGFSGHSTKRPVPVLLVEYANPWKILANSEKIFDWRPTSKYARTIYDPDYAPDAGEFKLRMVYITPRVAS